MLADRSAASINEDWLASVLVAPALLPWGEELNAIVGLGVVQAKASGSQGQGNSRALVEAQVIRQLSGKAADQYTGRACLRTRTYLCDDLSWDNSILLEGGMRGVEISLVKTGARKRSIHCTIFVAAPSLTPCLRQRKLLRPHQASR